jgi:hypothetical protein
MAYQGKRRKKNKKKKKQNKTKKKKNAKRIAETTAGATRGQDESRATRLP